MGRDLSISSMVRLPRLNSSSAVALAEQLLAAAASEGETLPLFIERPRGRLATALLALKTEIQPVEAVDNNARRSADKVLDAGWRVFSDWLGALSRMPDGALAEEARVRGLNELLFGNGLSFIILSYREEWTQSETRIAAAVEGGYEPLIESLGGGPLWANLKAAHARYGEVLGITVPLQAEESPMIRERMMALIDEMKAYVVKAAAYADPDEPGSEALSTSLLVPLARWTDNRISSKSEDVADDVVVSAAAGE